MSAQRIASEAQVTNLLRSLNCSEDVILQPGFYERVVDRIDHAQSRSVSSVLNSPVGMKLGTAVVAVTLFLGGFLAYSDFQDSKTLIPDSSLDRFESQMVPVTGDPGQQRDAVLINFAMYEMGGKDSPAQRRDR